MPTTGLHQQPTPERFFNAINAYEQTEAMKTAVELEIFTAIAEGTTLAAPLSFCSLRACATLTPG
jgi:hypothetical protein